MEINERVEINHQTINNAVELASLIGSYFSRKDYRKLLEEDFKLIQRLKKWLKWLKDWVQENVFLVLNWVENRFDKTQISQLEQIISQKEEEYQKMKLEIKQRWKKYFDMIIWDNDIEISELDLRDLLNWDDTVNVLDRIRQLYADEGVKQFYETQFGQRKAGFEMLEDWQKKMKEVFEIEAIIKKAKDMLLKLRIKAFMERRTLKSAEISLIRKIQDWVLIEQVKLWKLLQQREVATLYRLNSLKRYKYQLSKSWFVNVPSRWEIIDEVVEKLLLWENVLLSWPTGTGKTVLAIEAVKKMANQMNIWYEQINWKYIWDEIARDPNWAKSLLDEFAVVLSGHSGITTSEFIAKPSLKSDWNGWTYTDIQLWKLLKAFVEGKIPIIDEIDLIPNDILMRVKHLFTLKPWQEYSPQEDWDKRYILKTTSIIATANIKSEKHPDREELDPAIVRLFKWVQVPYLTLDESYDVAIAHLMENWWYIYDIDLNSLWEWSVLFNLIKSLKEIEESYLWIWSWLSVNIWWSDKSWMYLQKAVLELWNFVSMFKWFKESGLSFKEFMKWKIIEFVSNWAYPKNDRLLLIKIFSTNWLLISSDISRLAKRINDIWQSEFEKNIMWRNDIFTNEGPVKFIDPFELANLDPYNIRKLKDLELWNENKKIKWVLQSIWESYSSLWTQVWDKLSEFVEHILDKMESDPNYEVTDEEIKVLYDWLYQESDTQNLGRLSLLWDKWKKQFEGFKKSDTEDKLNWVNPEWTSNTTNWENPWSNIESTNRSKSLPAFIIDSYNRRINKLKSDWKMEVDWWEIDVNLTTLEKNWLREITNSEIKVLRTLRKDINIEWNREEFYVVQLEIRWLKYTAVEVPNILRNAPLWEMQMWKVLKWYSWNEWFPKIDLNQWIWSRWIIQETENHKWPDWKKHTNIQVMNQWKSTDVVREVAKLWMKTISVRESIVLWEIIKYWLWPDYMNFLWYKADEWQNWYDEVRKKIEKIDEYLWMKFWEYKPIDGKTYVIWNCWIYIDSKGNPRAFIRGNDDDLGCTGGLFSLRLARYLDDSHSYFGFRGGL